MHTIQKGIDIKKEAGQTSLKVTTISRLLETTTGCRQSSAILVVIRQPSVVSRQWPAVSRQPSVINGQSSVVSRQSSAVSLSRQSSAVSRRTSAVRRDI